MAVCLEANLRIHSTYSGSTVDGMVPGIHVQARLGHISK